MDRPCSLLHSIGLRTHTYYSEAASLDMTYEQTRDGIRAIFEASLLMLKWQGHGKLRVKSDFSQNIPVPKLAPKPDPDYSRDSIIPLTMLLYLSCARACNFSW